MDAAHLLPIRINLPDQAPKLVRKEQLPDQRQIVVLPIRAFTDKRLTASQLRVLGVCCSYANKAGLLWAGLERMGKDLGVSKVAVFHQVKKLEQHGYIRTVFHGFRGERAATRQILFNPDLSARQAMQKTGEAAPFQIEKQQQKERKESRKAARERQKSNTSMVNEVEDNQTPMQSVHDVMRLKNKVSDKIWQLAVARAGTDNDYDKLKQAIDKLLR